MPRKPWAECTEEEKEQRREAVRRWRAGPGKDYHKEYYRLYRKRYVTRRYQQRHDPETGPKIREQTRIRTARHYAKQKALESQIALEMEQMEWEERQDTHKRGHKRPQAATKRVQRYPQGNFGAPTPITTVAARLASPPEDTRATPSRARGMAARLGNPVISVAAKKKGKGRGEEVAN